MPRKKNSRKRPRSSRASSAKARKAMATAALTLQTEATELARFRKEVRARKRPETRTWVVIGYDEGPFQLLFFRRCITNKLDGTQIFVLRSPKGWEVLLLWTPRLLWWRKPTLPTSSFPSPAVTEGWQFKPPLRVFDSCPVRQKDGTRCGGCVVYGPVCDHHLSERYGLCVRPSSVPNGGLGLWTTRRLAVDSGNMRAIVPYGGEIISARGLATRYPDGKPNYVLASTCGRYFLDSQVKRGAGAMANCCSGHKYRTNVSFDGWDNRTQLDYLAKGDLQPYEMCPMWLVAFSTISKGKELFVNYLCDTWQQEMKQHVLAAQASSAAKALQEDSESGSGPD
jgi:hypothetical protein